MLQQVLHIIIISAITIVWGLPCLLLLKKKNPAAGDSFWIRSTLGLYCFLYFAGLITLSFTTSILCLFAPLKFNYLLIGTAGLLFYIYYKKSKLQLIFSAYKLTPGKHSIEFIFICICILIFILVGTLKPVNGDTQIYHVQIIKWFNNYGAVPGIANLFPRYGLGSNWFNLISIFKLPFFSNYNYTWLNTTTVIWFFLWLMSNWKFHRLNTSTNLPNKILGLLYFCLIIYSLFEWELFRDAANSTNYDFIVTALTITITLFLIEEILIPPSVKKFSYVFVIVCISLIPLKLSGIFAAILLFYYLLTFKKIKYWIISFIAGAVILIPLLIKNYIITGYLLFPISITFFSPEWQVPVAMTDYLRQYIHVTNRFYNIPINYQQIPELMHKNWISLWFSGILIQQKIIILGAISSIGLLFVNPIPSIKITHLKVIISLMLLMALAWFYSAPSPRFGYGVLLILAFLPVCLIFGKFISQKIYQLILLMSIVLSCYYLYKKGQPIINDPNHLLYTFNLDKPPVNDININGITFYLPELINNGWMRDCFDTKLPCISQENKYLQLRGNTIKEGFKMLPISDSIFIRQYIY